MKKKILLIVTALVLAIAMMPTLVFADDGDITVKVTIKNDNFASALLNDSGMMVSPAWVGTQVDNYEVVLAKNETAGDAVASTCSDHDIAIVMKNSTYRRYVANIDGLKEKSVGIMTDPWSYAQGDWSGWKVMINGTSAYAGLDYYINTDTPDTSDPLGVSVEGWRHYNYGIRH